MSFQAIAWDLEGVLLRTKDADVPTTLAKRLDTPVEKVRSAFYSDFNNRMDLGNYTHDDFWDHIIQTLGLPDTYRVRLNDFLQNDYFVDEGMLADIKHYREKYQTVLLTNFSRTLRPMLASHWHVEDAFDKIIISCEIGMVKPNADIFQHTLDTLGCDARQMIFIDDKDINIVGAQKLGIPAILYKNRKDMNQKIQELLENFG